VSAVLKGNIIGCIVMMAHFKEVGDPVVAVSFFQIGEQVDRQL
jgi:hypothetical protein